MTIKTTLDMKVQAALQQAVDAVVPPSSPVTAVIAAVQPGTGAVLGIAANRSYSSAGRPTDTKLGYLGYRTTFQGGSTFKIFTLAAALSQNINVNTSLFASSCYRPDPAAYDTPGPTGPCPLGYQNSDPAEAATYNMVTGTWSSVNTYFIQLEEKTGVQNIIDTAKRMGIRGQDFGDLGSRSLSVTLGGVNGVSPLEEATAYATLAAHGLACTPNPIASVRDATGQPITVSEHRSCRQALTPAVADTITGILEGVLTTPGATAYGKGLSGRPSAGKTGTLDQEKAAWFSGYTPQLAASVVLGNPAAPDTPLGTVEGVNPVYGGTLPAQIWQQAMNAALLGVPAQAMPAPAVASPPGFANPYRYRDYPPAPPPRRAAPAATKNPKRVKKKHR